MTTHRTRPRWTIQVCLPFLLGLLPEAAVAQAVPIERLQAEDREAGDLFGCALDLRVDERRAVLLVGSLRDDDLGPDSGSAYVFELAPGDEGWRQTAKILAPDGAAGDELGFSVALAPGGDDALLGAPLAGAGGAVYRYERGRAGGWQLAGRFTAGESGAGLGSAVVFAGSLVAAGAPTAMSGGRADAGAVFLFAGAGGPVRRLAAGAPRAGDGFGWSLAAGDGTLAVGAPWADGRFTDTGAVHLFELEGAGPGTLLLAPDAAPFDAFGYSVALEGDLLAVSAPRADGGAGAVYLFRRGAAGFALEARLAGTVPGAQLGTSVSLAGGVLAAGARREGASVGAVRLFRRQAGAWVETERFAAPLARGGDEVGIDVAISGDGLAAGAYKDDTGGTDAGSVHVRVPPRMEEEPPPPPPPPPPPVVADLRLDVTAGSDSAVPGEALTYTLELCNDGPSAAPHQFFGTGPLGPSLLDPAWTCSGSGGAACAPASGTGPIAGRQTLPAGGCVTYELSVRIAPCATLPVVLAGSLGAPAFDPDPANNADQATTALTPEAELLVAIEPDRLFHRAGETSTFVVRVVDLGPSCASGFTVRSPLPRFLAPASWTCTPDPGDTCSGGVGGMGALEDRPTLLPGTEVVYSVTSLVLPGYLGPETVTASLETPIGLDPEPGTDFATGDVVLLPPRGEVAAVKSVVGDFLVGAAVQYRIVVANGGPADLPDAPGFELIDALPPEVELISAEASRGTIVPDEDGLDVFWDGDLPADGFVVITVTVRILPVAQGSLVSNQASFLFFPASDPDLAVEGKTAPPGSPEEGPTTFTVQALIEVPAASPRGLVLLALLLAAAAAVLLRRPSA